MFKRRISNDQVLLVVTNDAIITGYSNSDFLPFINKGKRKYKKLFFIDKKSGREYKAKILLFVTTNDT